MSKLSRTWSQLVAAQTLREPELNQQGSPGSAQLAAKLEPPRLEKGF